MRPFLLLVVALSGLVAPLGATNVQVIANPGLSVTELSADELRDIFLGKKTTLGGGAVEPVFEQAGEVHQQFLKAYLGKSDAALRVHFKALVFTGKGKQPKTFASEADVVKYVLKTKGAIAYVSAATDISGARKIQVK